jgi:hypothetical protein
MIKNYFFNFLVLALLISVTACKKSINNQQDPIDTNPQPVAQIIDSLVQLPNSSIVVFSVAGKVLDENNVPKSGVIVNGGGKTTVTDSKGVFKINKGSFTSAFATITFKSPGYFTITKTVDGKSIGLKYINIKLSKLNLAGSVGVSGGLITFNNASIKFTENSFLFSNGTVVNEPVNVYITTIDPTVANSNLVMPGNLIGVTVPSTISILKSYGMIGVELRTANGTTVQLAPSKKATITMAIPSSMLASAPATIPLWYFSDKLGLWVQQGNANKVGNNYIGEVNHFTFWNYDHLFLPAIKEFRFLKKSDKSYLAYHKVGLEYEENPGYIYYDYTDEFGHISTLYHPATSFKLKFYNSDNTILFDTTFLPFSVQPKLDTILINVPVIQKSFTGVALNCIGAPVQNGSATIVIDSLNYSAKITNGEFVINIPQTVLTIGSSYSLNGFDSTSSTALVSNNFIYNAANVTNTGIYYTCNTLPAEFINYSLDGGATQMFIRNIDSAFCRSSYAFNRTEISCRRANSSISSGGLLSFVTGPTSVSSVDTSTLLQVVNYISYSTPPSIVKVSYTEKFYSYPPNLATAGWVIGNYLFIFKDEQGVLHTLKTNIKMYRRPN